MWYSFAGDFQLELHSPLTNSSGSSPGANLPIFVLFCIQNEYLVTITHGQLITIRTYIERVLGQYPPGQYPPGQYPPDNIHPDNIPPGQYPPGQYPLVPISPRTISPRTISPRMISLVKHVLVKKNV